jgi:hypothetical protein
MKIRLEPFLENKTKMDCNKNGGSLELMIPTVAGWPVLTNISNGLPLIEPVIGTPYEEKAFHEVLMDSARSLNEVQIFNNASQAWNNDFFLRTLVRARSIREQQTITFGTKGGQLRRQLETS